MKITSNVTGLTYDGEGMVYIVNPIQSARYLKHNAVLYDIFENQDKVIFVFSRDDTMELYDLWCRRELK